MATAIAGGATSTTNGATATADDNDESLPLDDNDNSASSRDDDEEEEEEITTTPVKPSKRALEELEFLAPTPIATDRKRGGRDGNGADGDGGAINSFQTQFQTRFEC